MARSSHLLLRSDPLLPPLLLLSIRLLLPQIRILFHLRLVQSIDKGILPLLHIHPTNHLLIFEAHLTCRHTAGLLQVAPWRVDDGDIILLVALDAVGFRELSAIGEQVLGDVLPLVRRVRRREAQVDVCGGEVVDVEPDVLCYILSDHYMA